MGCAPSNSNINTIVVNSHKVTNNDNNNKLVIEQQQNNGLKKYKNSNGSGKEHHVFNPDLGFYHYKI